MTYQDITEGQAVIVRTDYYGKKLSHHVESVSKVDKYRIYTRQGGIVFSRKDGRCLNAGAQVMGYHTYIEIYQPETVNPVS